MKLGIRVPVPLERYRWGSVIRSNTGLRFQPDTDGGTGDRLGTTLGMASAAR
jgi:hypothetical protein